MILERIEPGHTRREPVGAWAGVNLMARDVCGRAADDLSQVVGSIDEQALVMDELLDRTWARVLGAQDYNGHIPKKVLSYTEQRMDALGIQRLRGRGNRAIRRFCALRCICVEYLGKRMGGKA